MVNIQGHTYKLISILVMLSSHSSYTKVLRMCITSLVQQRNTQTWQEWRDHVTRGCSIGVTEDVEKGQLVVLCIYHNVCVTQSYKVIVEVRDLIAWCSPFLQAALVLNQRPRVDSNSLLWNTWAKLMLPWCHLSTPQPGCYLPYYTHWGSFLLVVT